MTQSLLPLDVGFDIKITQTPVIIENIDAVKYLDSEGNIAETEGDRSHLATVLSKAGYKVVVELTPNGREIRCEKGRFAVQPPNDNYWVECKTLQEARKVCRGFYLSLEG